MVRVQRLKICGHKQTVLADDLAVKGNGSAPIIGPLDQNHVPVDGGFVAVVCVLIGVAWCEVQTARDFFIKKNVFTMGVWYQ